MTNTINSSQVAFGSCAILGNRAEAYMAERLKKEGPHAVAEFKKFCDGLTNWGYVNINKGPSDDQFILQGSNITTRISKNTPLEDLAAKLRYLKEYKGIIDQG